MSETSKQRVRDPDIGWLDVIVDPNVEGIIECSPAGGTELRKASAPWLQADRDIFSGPAEATFLWFSVNRWLVTCGDAAVPGTWVQPGASPEDGLSIVYTGVAELREERWDGEPGAPCQSFDVEIDVQLVDHQWVDEFWLPIEE